MLRQSGLTSLSRAPVVPVSQVEADKFELQFRDHIGYGLQARGKGIGLREVRVGTGATPEQGWVVQGVKGSGEVATVHCDIDTVLALGAAQEGHGWSPEREYEEWVDSVIEHVWTLLVVKLEPPKPEPTENDQVFKDGILGDKNDMVGVELHPDFAAKLGDMAGEIQQQITGRRL